MMHTLTCILMFMYYFRQRQKLNVENFKDISFSYINNGTI